MFIWSRSTQYWRVLGPDGDSGVLLQPVKVHADSGEAGGETSPAAFGSNEAGDSNLGWVAIVLVHHQRTTWVTLCENSNIHNFEQNYHWLVDHRAAIVQICTKKTDAGDLIYFFNSGLKKLSNISLYYDGFYN